MKIKFFLASVTLMLILSGCSTISQSKAEELIREEYRNHLGDTTIISTEEDADGYIIEWENKNNKHRGTSKISNNGEITIIYAEIE
ncbi:hypothetical protein [Desemzia sp. FAM 23989]|uniref:hypothetical protein n=2 Tax=Desemzia TaxID=82800 RepID=UPI003889B9AE